MTLDSRAATIPDRFGSRRAVILAAALATLTFVAAAGVFATVQTIWVDETTQLTGLALDWRERLLWLLGRSDLDSGVPLDRMPPLGYVLGGLWAALFGLTEISMRWFGIVAVAAAAPALFMAGRRAAGPLGGLFCLTFLLLSPNLISQSVAIRAYPLFFTFCAWGTWCFALLVIDREPERPRGRATARRGGPCWR
mgnify:CR=1 FL=1